VDEELKDPKSKFKQVPKSQGICSIGDMWVVPCVPFIKNNYMRYIDVVNHKNDWLN